MFDIENCTLQEACDYAVQMIVKQGYRCVSEDYQQCAYVDQGNHCALGWLLKDHQEFDRIGRFRGSVDLLTQTDIKLPKLITDNIEVFVELQKFHDFDSSKVREFVRAELNERGIDTSKTTFDTWVSMGL